MTPRTTPMRASTTMSRCAEHSSNAQVLVGLITGVADAAPCISPYGTESLYSQLKHALLS